MKRTKTHAFTFVIIIINKYEKIFIILFSAISLSAFAQDDVKRIAILETVDRAGDVNLGVKNLLRQSITFGINRIPGYEGYNRVDMVQITGEQNFQRTGYVSDADIKKLGVMTGASYVLIAEATKYDETHILVYANLVDVESGRITNSSIPKVAGIAPNEMYEDCAEVAKSLLGVSKETKAYNVSNSQTVPSGYVDLGLPSGTLWKAENEDCGLIAFDKAYNFYGSSMPTKEQWEELKDFCLWTWLGNGYKVKGKNGESILLPVSGSLDRDGSKLNINSGGYFWSSSMSGSGKDAWGLYCHSTSIGIELYSSRMGKSVRLVINNRSDQEEIARQEAERKAKEAEAVAKANTMGSLFGQSGNNSNSSYGQRGNPVGHGSAGGSEWSMSGRGIKGTLPMPSNDFKQEGKVIVQIRVNAAGQVVNATIKGGDIRDSYTQQLALDAARKAKFTEGDHDQIGTITYIFKLN